MSRLEEVRKSFSTLTDSERIRHVEAIDSIAWYLQDINQTLAMICDKMDNVKSYEKYGEFVRLLTRDVDGKPYYEIEYIAANGEHCVGFSSFNLEIVSGYLKDYFDIKNKAVRESGGE